MKATDEIIPKKQEKNPGELLPKRETTQPTKEKGPLND